MIQPYRRARLRRFAPTTRPFPDSERRRRGICNEEPVGSPVIAPPESDVTHVDESERAENILHHRDTRGPNRPRATMLMGTVAHPLNQGTSQSAASSLGGNN